MSTDAQQPMSIDKHPIIDRVETKRAINDELYILLVASNGKIIFQSETYANDTFALQVAERAGAQLGVPVNHRHTPVQARRS